MSTQQIPIVNNSVAGKKASESTVLQGINSALANKIDKVAGERLIPAAEVDRLATMTSNQVLVTSANNSDISSILSAAILANQGKEIVIGAGTFKVKNVPLKSYTTIIIPHGTKLRPVDDSPLFTLNENIQYIDVSMLGNGDIEGLVGTTPYNGTFLYISASESLGGLVKGLHIGNLKMILMKRDVHINGTIVESDFAYSTSYHQLESMYLDANSAITSTHCLKGQAFNASDSPDGKHYAVHPSVIMHSMTFDGTIFQGGSSVNAVDLGNNGQGYNFTNGCHFEANGLNTSNGCDVKCGANTLAIFDHGAVFSVPGLPSKPATNFYNVRAEIPSARVIFEDPMAASYQGAANGYLGLIYAPFNKNIVIRGGNFRSDFNYLPDPDTNPMVIGCRPFGNVTSNIDTTKTYKTINATVLNVTPNTYMALEGAFVQYSIDLKIWAIATDGTAKAYFHRTYSAFFNTTITLSTPYVNYSDPANTAGIAAVFTMGLQDNNPQTRLALTGLAGKTINWRVDLDIRAVNAG